MKKTKQEGVRMKINKITKVGRDFFKNVGEFLLGLIVTHLLVAICIVVFIMSGIPEMYTMTSTGQIVENVMSGQRASFVESVKDLYKYQEHNAIFLLLGIGYLSLFFIYKDINRKQKIVD